MSRATVADVARLAGVSTATVSRVLTGSVPVSEALRNQVESAATELGYFVNTAARALRRDRTSTVGMVVPDLTNPFFTTLVDGVERGIQELGMSLHLCSSSNSAETEAARVRSLRQSQVEVLVISPVHVTASEAALNEPGTRIPIVQLDQFADGVDSDWVGIDEQRGMRLVFEHLAAQGVRTAAYVGAAPSDSSARGRQEAARRQSKAKGVDLNISDALQGAFSVDWGMEAGRRLAQGELPNAIVCAADVIALGVMQAFDDAGIRVPEDVLLTGFDDIPLSSYPRLSITTVRQPVQEIADVTVDIIREIRDDPGGHIQRRVAIRPELIPRHSSDGRIA